MNAINARARVYTGPKRIKYGSSIGGKGGFSYVTDSRYDVIEREVILDDQIYIFHHNIIDKNGFTTFDPDSVRHWFFICGQYYSHEHEWAHSNCWLSRNIPLNVVGLNLILTKLDAYSGDINIANPD
jgi:hypothetical protein